MLYDVDILWSKEKVNEIIKNNNSVKSSLLRLFRDTAISLGFLVLLWILERYTSRNLIYYENSVYFVFIVVQAWIYSIVFANVSSYVTSIFPNKDSIADCLEVTNRIQGTTIIISSGLVAVFSVILEYISNTDLVKPYLYTGLAIIIVLVIIMLINGLLMIRMLIYTLKKCYGLGTLMAIIVLICGHLIAAAANLILSIAYVLMLNSIL